MTEKKLFQFDVDELIKTKAPKIYPKIPHFLINYLKRKIHESELNEIQRLNADKEGVDYMRGAVNYFDLKFQVYGLENVPLNDRMIFVSNHPLGGLDGACLSVVIGERYDKKIKFLVNDLLYLMDKVRNIFIPINKYGTQSRETSKMIADAFESDNQIITFPAGLCSRKINGKVMDLDWGKMFIQKATEYQRDVVPIYFDGQNSNFFYRIANIRKRLGIKFNFEMLYLPDEMFKNKGKTFSIYFGKPIPWQTFDKSKSPKEWAEYVKNISYQLKNTER